MLTFREFYSISEGKKKQLVAAYLAGREQASPEIKNYGDSAPNSPERDAQIKAMMRDSGGGAIKRAQKQRLKQAVKAVKRIQKEESEMKTYTQLIEDLGEVRSKLMKKQRENVSSFTKKVKPKTTFRERLKQKALQKKLESL